MESELSKTSIYTRLVCLTIMCGGNKIRSLFEKEREVRVLYNTRMTCTHLDMNNYVNLKSLLCYCPAVHNYNAN